MNALINLVSFVVILGIMIFLHELGHFLAARAFRIRVEIFSLGFGKRLWGFTRGGVDYRVCAVPLGGYVKMAGEHFGEEISGDPDEFLSRPRWQRAVVTVAGPFMNLFLAVFLLWVNYMVGVEVPGFYHAPAKVGLVAAGSPSAGQGMEPGDVIVSANGSPVKSWADFVIHSVSLSNQDVNLVLRREGTEYSRRVRFGETVTDPSEISGIYPFVPARVELVVEGSPAARAGLRAGDEILSVSDGKSVVRGYMASSRMIRERAGEVDYPAMGELLFRAVTPAVGVSLPPGPASAFPGGTAHNPFSRVCSGRPLRLEVLRDGRALPMQLVPAATNGEDGRGLAGFQLDFQLVSERYGPWAALGKSVKDNVQFVVMTYRILAKVISGTLSIRQFSGPIGIARASGEAVKTKNLVVIFNFMALISMNLAVLNLLPIPVLDGGMLFFLLLEMIFRRNIPLRVKEKAVTAGLFLLLTFMAVVVFFDVIKAFQ